MFKSEEFFCFYQVAVKLGNFSTLFYAEIIFTLPVTSVTIATCVHGKGYTVNTLSTTKYNYIPLAGTLNFVDFIVQAQKK